MASTEPDGRSDERLAAVEDELYGASLDEFVARRDEAARAAKHDGDRQLADAIQSLRKPTTAAWALNSFARTNPAAIDALVDVGTRLRDAVERGDGDAIRGLMRERARSTATTLADVREHADEQGQPLSAPVAAQVEQTLRAASSSEDAARRLRRGVLTAGLGDAGLDALRAPSERPGPSRRVAERRSTDGTQVDDGRRRAAERRANEAAELVHRIEAEVGAAARRRQDLETEREAARERLEQIDRELHELRRSESDAQSRLRTARSQLRSARHAMDDGRPVDDP